MKKRVIGTLAVATVAALLIAGIVSASQTSTIDFEGLTEGATVITLDVGSGMSGVDLGFVSVSGHSADPAIAGNAAMIFDATCGGGPASNCTGGDSDLFQPALGNVLIITEDENSSDPDDADLVGAFFDFDFSEWGPGVVRVDSIDILDVDQVEEGGAEIQLFAGAVQLLGSPVPIPFVGDGNVGTVNVNISGVDFMRVTLNGSGAIDNIQITVDDEELPPFARITGGGWRVPGFVPGDPDPVTVRVSHGLTLHCDKLLSNNLQINFDKGQKWHIDKVVDQAFCDDSPFFTPEPPDAPADTYVGVDVGKLNNSGPAIACWVFEDHGETAGDGDGPDRALIRIFTGITLGAYSALFVPSDVDVTSEDTSSPAHVENACPLPGGATEVLFVPLSDLDGGNLQFHFDQPHKNK